MVARAAARAVGARAGRVAEVADWAEREVRVGSMVAAGPMEVRAAR